MTKKIFRSLTIIISIKTLFFLIQGFYQWNVGLLILALIGAIANKILWDAAERI